MQEGEEAQAPEQAFAQPDARMDACKARKEDRGERQIEQKLVPLLHDRPDSSDGQVQDSKAGDEFDAGGPRLWSAMLSHLGIIPAIFGQLLIFPVAFTLEVLDRDEAILAGACGTSQRAKD